MVVDGAHSSHVGVLRKSIFGKLPRIINFRFDNEVKPALEVALGAVHITRLISSGVSRGRNKCLNGALTMVV